jgi:uncharacterized protein
LSITVDFLLVGSAFLAGAINSVAGGGTFLTFPALLAAGISPITANVTSSIAVFPGNFAAAIAYRKDFKNVTELVVIPAIIASLVGGWFGATVLMNTPQKTFVGLIPWLILSSTLLFAFGKQGGDLLRNHVKVNALGTVMLFLLIGFYGGYFGAGIGILTLAVMGLLGMTDINKMNAVKTILTGFMNLAAVVNFLCNTSVYWHGMIIMTIACIIGGYAGAAVARRVPQKIVKMTVILIGVTLTIYFFVFKA